jgi:hypothetical protein
VKGGDDVPKTRHDVDYGPAWADVIREFGNPLGGEPVHSPSPVFDRPDEVYGPFATDADWQVPDTIEELPVIPATPEATEATEAVDQS